MRFVFCVSAALLLMTCGGSEVESVTASSGTTGTEASATTREPPATTKEPPVPATPAKRCEPAPRRLCPTDEAHLDPSLVAFRERMVEAVNEKDAAKLAALVDPAIRTSFGGEGGSAEFAKTWKLDSSDSPIWSELSEILQLGGSFRGASQRDSFWAPYVYANWPDAVDAFEHVAAIRADIPIRATPDPTAKEVAVVDWEILAVIRAPNQPANPDWRHVRPESGHEGWVRSADVRSPIDYRAGFSKRSGQWKMDAMVAGD